MPMINERGGLTPLPEDNRDFQLGAIFNLGDTSQLPYSFELELPFPVRDQGSTDYCSAFTTCCMSELQEGVELDPQFSFAVSKMISEDPDTWGQNMRDAMKAHVQVGAVPLGSHDIPLEDYKGRYIKNYSPILLEVAEEHKKQTYMSVKSVGADWFDSIRLALWKFKYEKRAVSIGVIFAWGLSEKVIDKIGSGGFGHMMMIYGWEGDYAKVYNWYNKSAGNNGTHLIHKDIINVYAPRYGAMMFIDMPKEEVKTRLEYGITPTDNWLVQLYKTFIGIIKSIWRI